jgi:hypothetical protein
LPAFSDREHVFDVGSSKNVVSGDKRFETPENTDFQKLSATQFMTIIFSVLILKLARVCGKTLVNPTWRFLKTSARRVVLRLENAVS